MKLTVAELRELMTAEPTSWSAALRKHVDALESAGDMRAIGDTCVALHRASEYLRLWLARVASEVGVLPPAATSEAPAPVISTNKEETP